ncbi:MAG TPA: tetratricopeptide repeat protein [Candidatus Angelobacter sp.]|nr:tetratricopeptide repeat protein [Candidatus Angelobacter sp.]
MDQAPHQSRVLKFGVFEVDLEGGELRKSGVRQKLTGQPFEVLRLLLERPQQVVTREELQKHLWPKDTFVDYDLAVKKAINRIREVLGDDAESPRFIETIPRRGYRFIAPISANGRDAVQLLPAEGRRPRLRLKFILLWGISIGLVLLALPAGGYFAWRHFHPRAQPPAGKIMLAVLPFQNLTGDPSQEYFSDGFTEEMITALGGLQPERLGVIARTSAMKYKHTDKAVDQIGRELGVQYVLEGSVRRDAGRTRISAQLIQVKDQSHLWAENYQRDLRDVFRVQNEVAEAIAGQIRLRLTPPEQARITSARPVNPEAHEAYLLGRFNWNKRNRDGMMTGLSYFQKAVLLDPKDPLGYTGIADSYITLGLFEYLPPTETFPLAKEAVLKALALDDTLVDAHSTLAQIYQSERDWKGTEQQCKRVLALNPNYALGHYRYSGFLSRAGRHEEAVAETRRASELDPLSPSMMSSVGQALLMARRYDEAQQALLKALELDPNYFGAHALLADTYAAKGMLEDSVAELKKAASLSQEDPWVQADFGYVYAKLGRKSDAEKVLNELRVESQRKYVSGFFVSWVCIGLGKNEEALQWLERAYQQNDYQLSWIGVVPVFDPLRSDPRFKDLLRRIGLPP